MKNILILGAGRSAGFLIDYLLESAAKNQWTVTVADASEELAKEKVAGRSNGIAIGLNTDNTAGTKEKITQSDIVISLLPPPLHPAIARLCLEHSKPFLTASYVSPDIQAMHEEATKKGVIVLMEMGLDPGIDHMSAKMELDKLKSEGAKLLAFRSYTGGLVAPESDNNPWHYKISWNPRNIVLAGQGTVKYLESGSYKYIPYHKLFSRVEKIEVEGHGEFEGYANRDSLKYLELYNVQNVQTFLRGTLRKPGYCSAWNALVQLGMTDDTVRIQDAENMTLKEFTALFVPEKNINALQRTFCAYLNIDESSDDMRRLKWLGLFSNQKIELKNPTPAEVLQKVLSDKWKLADNDKDMVVMQHQYEYEKEGVHHRKLSSLVVKGEDSRKTAMAKTVGWPLAIAAEMILEGKLTLKGVQIPVVKEIYEPVMKKLEEMGVKFVEGE